MTLSPIYKIQGDRPYSPMAGQTVSTQGVVTGIGRRGFFIQDVERTAKPPVDAEGCSQAIFVYYRGKMPPIGCELQLTGRVVDYIKAEPELDKPVTQLHFDEIRLIRRDAKLPQPIILSAELLESKHDQLAAFLNAHEAMLFCIEAGAEFVQPSNCFADYVVVPSGLNINNYARGAVAGRHGGYVFDARGIECWLPAFRTVNADDAPKVDVGDRLKNQIVGPLYYRAGAYQIVTSDSVEVERSDNRQARLEKATRVSRFRESEKILRVMTVNCLNLDPKIERASHVLNPDMDIDDDVGDLQFDRLGQAIAIQGCSPELVALQEIQDNDGAEQTHVTDASLTYELLIKAIQRHGGPMYEWADIPPKNQADGGQPGGNIRNGFLYRPDRVTLIPGSLKRLGQDEACFERSRKPLLATFQLVESQHDVHSLSVINVHLASKRHQASLFAPENPGFDAREATRIAQAEIIIAETSHLKSQGQAFYVTGDFNDVQGSATLQAFLEAGNANLVDALPESERFDYNHRGKLHVLMHGITDQSLVSSGKASYEILHGNELLGVRPGTFGDKPSDHAYVLAAIELS